MDSAAWLALLDDAYPQKRPIEKNSGSLRPQQYFVVHKGKALNLGFDKLLLTINIDQTQTIILGVDFIHGLHDEMLLFILNQVGIGFTHGISS
jgi:hypothetical protein